MSIVRTSAPGKLVFCGEYVVLDGAPAIGIAVNRRSVVSVSTAAGKLGTYRCPGFDDSPHSYAKGAAGQIDWQSASHLDLVEATAAGFPDMPLVDAILDTSAFSSVDSGDKLGLGSSASLSVSLTASFAQLAGESAGLAAAHATHRRFQEGRGSGIDVATCYAGGVIEFAIDRAADPRRLEWPAGLFFALFWTGVPSSTTGRLKQFEEAGNTKSRLGLAQASGDIINAWTDARDVLLAAAPYVDALRSFDRDLDLHMFAGGHEYLWGLAKKYPVVYKPCGAGGGDVGIALATDADAIDEFALATIGSGVERLDVKIDFDGLIVEEWSP